MRLLLITERFPPDLGGVARSAQRTAETLRRIGVDVETLAWTKLLPAGALDSREGVHRLGLFGNLDFSLQHTINVVEWLHAQRRYDAIWGHYLFPAGFMAVLLAETLGLASTVSARGNDVDRLMFPPGDFARLGWTLQRATVVSAVSHDLARKIEVLLGRPLEIEVVHNSVDGSIYRPLPPEEALRERIGIRPEEAVLGFCGELRQKKGLPFLLEALGWVRDRRPCCLLVIGDIRGRDQALLSSYLAERPEHAERILVTGQIDDPAEIAWHLALCDVFLQPSVWDGLPNALLEAMACERVVIASDAGGIPEVVEDGRSGRLLPRAALIQLGPMIAETLDWTAEEKRRFGQAARERVLDVCHPGREEAALTRLVARLEPSSSS